MNRLQPIWRSALALILCLGVAQTALAQGRRETGPVFTESLAHGGFVLVEAGRAPTIVVDPGDAAVVRHAADDLADDIKTVTAQQATVAAAPGGKTAILVGTLGHSKLIDQIDLRHECAGARRVARFRIG